MTLNHVFVLPATDGARWRFVGHTAPAQRTRVTIGFAADITNLDPAARVDLAALRRLQRRAGRTAVSIRRRIVAEVFVAEAALRLQTPDALGLRNISHDAIFLAALERCAVVIADVGERLQRLSGECLLRSLGHLIELAR